MSRPPKLAFPYVPSIPDGHAEHGAKALHLPGHALRGHRQAAEHGARRRAEAELQQGGAIEDAQAVLGESYIYIYIFVYKSTNQINKSIKTNK